MEGLILGNRYELLEKIGGGGMAIVYKAKCRLLNRYVAVKILRLEYTNDEEFIKRFQVEAQSAASLSHPNIVSVYDVGQEENIHYIVMEYIDGITLKEYIDQKKSLSWQEAVNISIQICSAIEHAHSKHIVHRDIKPHNIMLTSDGIAKVTDFGIARAVSSSTITVVGSTIGSVHYFSPEQDRGGYIDEKSDLYSLGIALYEMVTGRLPFNGESPVAIALMHIQETPVQPAEIKPSIPKGLNAIIMKAIMKEQDKRYQTATEMLKDLQRVLKEPEGTFVKLELQGDAPTKRINAITEQQLAEKDDSLSKNDKNKTKKKRKDKIVIVLAICIALVIIGIAGLLTANYFLEESNQEKNDIVPNFVNSVFDNVKSQAEKNFLVKEIKIHKDDIEKGIIYKQDPVPGKTYKKDGYTELKLYVSDGPDMITIPKLTGKEPREAEVELKNLGFKFEYKEEFSDVGKGLVTRTDPEGGTQAKSGALITIFKSKGVEIKTTKVPNLKGLTEAAAIDALQKANLKVGKIYPEDQSSRVDEVDSQKPEAGKEVDESSPVDIWFSQAGKSDRVNVNHTISLIDAEDYKDPILVKIDITPSDTNQVETIYEMTKKKDQFPFTVKIPVPVGGLTQVTVYFNNELADSFTKE